MAWFVLIFSGVLEAVWATALGASEGFTKPVPTAIFLVSVVLSMIGLAWAMKFLPISVAYAVWTGIGAGLAVLYAMVWGAEPATLPRIVFLTGIIAAIAGLKATARTLPPQPAADQPSSAHQVPGAAGHSGGPAAQ